MADIENDVMMGLDFMQRHKCSIDIVSNVLSIAGKDISLNCSGCQTVPLRIMNSSDEPQKLFKGTCLAKLSPVMEVKKGFATATMHTSLPAHLQTLYERSVVGLDAKQRKAVALKICISQSSPRQTMTLGEP